MSQVSDQPTSLQGCREAFEEAKHAADKWKKQQETSYHCVSELERSGFINGYMQAAAQRQQGVEDNWVQRELPILTEIGKRISQAKLDELGIGVVYVSKFDKTSYQHALRILETRQALTQKPTAPDAWRGALEWHRLGDKLPPICVPILLAKKSRDDEFWSVRDAQLYIKYEEVTPSLKDIANGKRTAEWWFASVYPGNSDIRLPHKDLMWALMPQPLPPAPTQRTESND